MTVDVERLKRMVLAGWRKGGLDTLVKVMPYHGSPDPNRSVGYCTSLKYIAGCTPAEMENRVGFTTGSKLLNGAAVFLVRPLPNPADFDLKAYTQLPGGVATNDPGYVPHPDYPPGLGVPQWDLARVKQLHLVLLTRVPPGQRLRVNVRSIPFP